MKVIPETHYLMSTFLLLEILIGVRAMVFNATFNNISAI